MSSGERPIGAAKGKQTDTEALCQTPPPTLPPTPPPRPPQLPPPPPLTDSWGGVTSGPVVVAPPGFHRLLTAPDGQPANVNFEKPPEP